MGVVRRILSLDWVNAKKVAIFLIVVGVIVYSRVWLNGFVGDDEDLIVKNLSLHSIANWREFFTGGNFYTGGAGGLSGIYYKPLVSIFLASIYTVFGPSAGWFHLIQLGMHTANSTMVFVFSKKFFRAKIAFFAALIFLVHPINTEAVVYVAAFQEILFFFFGMAGFLIFTRESQNRRSLFLATALLLCSILVKESGILFFLAVGLFDFLFRKKALRRDLICCLIAVAVYLFLRLGVAHIFLNGQILSPMMSLNLSQRIFSMPKILSFYLSTFFYPKNLLFSQNWVVQKMDWPNFFLPIVQLALVVIGIFFVGKICWKNKRVEFLFFLGLLVFGLGMHLQVVPLDMTVSDRWFYFPILGILGLLGLFLERFIAEKNFFWVSFLVFGIAVLLAIRSFFRVSDWRDPLTLYSHDELVNTDSFALEGSFGGELVKTKQFDLAEKHLQKSVKLFPTYSNWNNLGVLNMRRGRLDDALVDYREALKFGKYYLAYENVAGVLVFSGKNKEAEEFVGNALKIFPQNQKLWIYLAVAKYARKDRAGALSAAQNAQSILPNAETDYLLSTISSGGEIKLGSE